MNAQVKFPFRLRSTPFCRFRYRRRFRFVAFAFKKCSRSVSFVSSRSHFVAFAFCFVADAFHCSFPWRLRSVPFHEHVRVAYVYCQFLCSFAFRGFFVRFSPILQAFTISTLYVQRSFCAGVCAERKWKRNFSIKGVAFGCTQSGGARRFRALVRTLDTASRYTYQLTGARCSPRNYGPPHYSLWKCSSTIQQPIIHSPTGWWSGFTGIFRHVNTNLALLRYGGRAGQFAPCWEVAIGACVHAC